jgi:uncharacterized small protein (DUF1192 family)
MAISETTKQIAAEKRDNLRSQIESIDSQIAVHQKDIDSLKAQKVALKAQKDALTADIPEPTPAKQEI